MGKFSYIIDNIKISFTRRFFLKTKLIITGFETFIIPIQN
jgi:hypothetical protein